MADSGGDEEAIELYVQALLGDGTATREIRLVPAWEPFGHLAPAVAFDGASASQAVGVDGASASQAVALDGASASQAVGVDGASASQAVALDGASASQAAHTVGGAADGGGLDPLPAVERMNLIVAKGGQRVATLELAPAAAHGAGARGAAASHVTLHIDPEEGQAILRIYRDDASSLKWISTWSYSLNADFSKEELNFLGHVRQDLPFPPFQISFQRSYSSRAKIGTGSEGTVHKCHSLFMGAKFSAVKEISQALQSFRDPGQKNCEPSEVKIMSLLNHVGIVRFYQAWAERDSLFIGMKLCQRTLRACLNETSEGIMENGRFICQQLAKAVEFMHDKGVVHRDIKPGNVLLDGLLVRLADYGLAVRKKANQSDFSGGCYGSLPYRAPEIVSIYRRHNEKVDIFSFGMIYYEIFLAGDKSKRKMKVEKLSDIIREGIAEYDQKGLAFDLDEYIRENQTDLFEGWEGEYRVLKATLRTEPSERPSAAQILDLLHF